MMCNEKIKNFSKHKKYSYFLYNKKINGVILLAFMLPALVLSGCGTTRNDIASDDPDFIKAKKLLEYHAGKYDDMEATGTLENGVRTIEINAYRFFFEPNLVIVNKGERIRVIIEAMDIPHGFEIEGFTIPDYDINTVIRKGKPLVIEFEADEKGVWEFICTVYCGYGHSEMKGILVVR